MATIIVWSIVVGIIAIGLFVVLAIICELFRKDSPRILSKDMNRLIFDE